MASYGHHFSSDSPVLALSPQPSHRGPFAMSALASSHAADQAFVSPLSRNNGASPTVHRTTSSAGRKRSRDEASANLEPDVPLTSAPAEEEWTYGEGMTLIKPGTGYVPDASTQSGTWLDEQNAAEEANRQRLQEEQMSRTRASKSQRKLDNGVASLPQPLPGLNASKADADQLLMATSGSKGPIVDDFTLQLGIGWRRISDDEHIQAAARGWSRYIENHYPLTNVNIHVESKGLQSYLVEAREGYFLFAEDLRQGQLVSVTAEGALRNLQSNPPRFDGEATLCASGSPQSSPPAEDAPSLDMDMSMG